MKIQIKNTIIVLVCLMTFTFSCTDDFIDLQKNPNAFTPENVTPSFLLADVISASVLDPGMHQRMTQLTNDVFAQYWANEAFSTQQGVTNDEWVSSFYSSYHSRFVANLSEGIRLGRASAAAGKPLNETQIARIWKVWVFSRATDIWGDIPYFGAADGTGENPVYDDQQDIYTDMLKELSEAVDSLSTDNPVQISGQDYVYGDDIAKWKKFGNSLRLRLAMRISEADPALAQQHAEAAIAHPSGVFASAEDECKVTRTATFGWGFQYPYTFYYGWGGLHMSRSMENLLTGLGGQPIAIDTTGMIVDDEGFDLPSNENSLDPKANKFRLGVPSVVDPRGPIYFSPAVGAEEVKVANAAGDTVTVDTRNRWIGVPAGLSTGNSALAEHVYTNISIMGPTMSTDAERPLEILTYHELCFLMAEAAQRGWNAGGTAKDWYEAGIAASMAHHGVDAATTAAYIASSDENTYGTTVAFDNNSGKSFNGTAVDDAMGKIITQKYLALFPDGGWEAWADHRRLHLPVLIPMAAPDARYTARDGGPDNFTKRITYPSTEQINNNEYYEAAVESQGADVETTSVWWDQ